MGMHLNIPDFQLLDKATREHRKRVWWSAYVLDRTWASKLGHPVSIQDEDVHVDLPMGQDLAAKDSEDFGDCDYIRCSVELAKLAERTYFYVYSRRKHQSPFAQRVQHILKDLTKWVESLPPHLQLDRNVQPQALPNYLLYLHLTFNQVCCAPTIF
jgi:proline utilization trans-activator